MSEKKYRQLTEEEKEKCLRNIERLKQEIKDNDYWKRKYTMILEEELDIGYRQEKMKYEQAIRDAEQRIKEAQMTIDVTQEQLEKGVPILEEQEIDVEEELEKIKDKEKEEETE